MNKIYAFDFDGTLTRRDTLLEFIRYTCGNKAFCKGFLRPVAIRLSAKDSCDTALCWC